MSCKYRRMFNRLDGRSWGYLSPKNFYLKNLNYKEVECLSKFIVIFSNFGKFMGKLNLMKFTKMNLELKSYK